MAANDSIHLVDRGREHEVSVEHHHESNEGEGSVSLTVLNRRTGDTFRRAWDAPAVSQVLPLSAPQALHSLANFHALVRGALECEAGFTTAAEALGPGTQLSGRSFEERDNYTVFITLRDGDGPLASRHEITLQVPLHDRASVETRHELALRRERANFAEQTGALQRDLDHVRSESRRKSTSLIGCTILLALGIAALLLAPPADSDARGSNTSATHPDPEASCLIHELRVHPEVYATATELAVAVFGVLLLTIGRRLLGAVLFICGFISAAALCLVLTESIFYQTDFFNCSLLGITTVCGGLLGGVVARTGRSASFFLLGALSGAAIGWYTYILAVGALTQHRKAGTVWYWATVGIPALFGGCLLACHHGHRALAISSSVLGACAVVIALDMLVLEHRDHRFTSWLAPCHGNILHPAPVDRSLSQSMYVLGPVMAAASLSVLGACFQCWCQQEPERPASVREVPVGLLNAPLLSAVDSGFAHDVVVAQAVPVPPAAASVNASVPIEAAVHVQAPAPQA